MLEFIIPTVKNDLLKSTPGQFCVEEVLSSRLIPVKLQDAKVDLLKADGLTIEKHFEIFFSILCKFNEIDITIKRSGWTILLKASERFCSILHKALENESNSKPIWESSERVNYLKTLKMLVYLLVQMSDMYQSSSAISNKELTPKKGKKKLKSKENADKLGLDWENECNKSFQLLMNYVDLDIHRLWPAQLVEDEFTSLISSFCYKVLEDPTIIKNKTLKSNVFHLLGCLIKKHNQSLSTSLKIVQMMQHFEHVGAPFAEAMQLWVATYKCRSLMPELLRELSNIEEKELIRDSVSTRTICNFIQDVAKLLPVEVLSHVCLLMSRMDEDSYPMRNTVLTVFGEILVQCLNGEDLSEKSRADRDQFLDILHDHANLDVNAFVRSKAVQIITSLVKSEVLPIKRCSKVTDLGIRLLIDKSNLVRKAAVQLLESLLRWNPFAATLSIAVLKDGLDDAKRKMEELTLEQKTSTADGVDAEASDDADKSGSPNEEDLQETSSIAEANKETEEAPETDDSETAKLQRVHDYLSDAVEFVEKFHEAVPVLCHLLDSKTQSDVLEAISFFAAAWEFKLSFAVEGISRMLDQIWNEDQKIRDAVVSVYKEFYFKLSDKSTNQVKQIVDNMMILAASSTEEKLKAFEALIDEMSKSGDITSGVAQLLWSRFVDPPSSFTMERGISESKQRRVAVQLLGMLANHDPTIVTSKIGVLADVGLTRENSVVNKSGGDDDAVDFELATHTCVTLLKMSRRNAIAGTYKKQFRLPNNHNIFTNITSLLVDGFTRPSSNWVVFAFEATSVLFQLASKPAELSKTTFERLFSKLNEFYSDDASGEIVDRLLSRFFAISGHFALKFLIFVDGDIQSEMKRRRKLEEEKEESAAKKKKSKRKSRALNKSKADNLEEDMGVGGATADDADQEVIKNVLESEIVAPGTMLGSVTELMVRSCTVEVPREDQRAVEVQLSASLALSKYMLVSSEFCEKHMRLFFTMLQSSPHEGVRANLTIAAGDLCVRFPNLLEPWTSNIYARLNDESTMVRIYAIKVLTNLILHDMIKVKGHVSEMAKCIADENARIAMLAKRFFQELSKKGNSVYNVMPDIISRLSDPDVGLKDDVDFKSIMRFLFDFIQKDKQSESLVEKLCHRFKATRDIQQWRDLAFCLSLLNYSEKAIKKLIENFSFYANILRDEQVYYSFDTIISKSKKFAKPELKAQIDELEGKIIDHHHEGLSEDQSSARAAEASKRNKLSRPQSVSQAPPEQDKSLSLETPKKKFAIVRSMSVSCEKLPLNKQLSPLPSQPHTMPRKRTNMRAVSSPGTSRKKMKYFGNKRNLTFLEARSQKKRREGNSKEEVAASLPSRRTTRRRPVVINFSDDEDDFEEDAKENLNAHDENEENLNLSLISNVSTPIRRKKTPKRADAKSALRA